MKPNAILPRLAGLVWLVLGVEGAAERTQIVLQGSKSWQAPPSSQTYQILQDSKRFPDHSVRVRHPDTGLCDDTVDQMSGYLDLANGRHLYFYQFDSRNDKKKDPVILWLNGGPGCSSFTGLMMELGPCRVQEPPLDPKRNPLSWNNNATVIFLDQPSGVGFSYSDKYDPGVWTTEEAAKDAYAFLQLLFSSFKEKFEGRDFHIAGESYAGRYIPVFADYIMEQNKLGNGLAPINIKSVMIGNGFTDPRAQYKSYHPTVCTNVTGYGPYVDEENCAKMQETLPRCIELIQTCYDYPDVRPLCTAASAYCEKTQTEPYLNTGRNPYDMTKFGDYEEEEYLDFYLNRDDVRIELGVDYDENGELRTFEGCSSSVGYRFAATGDEIHPSYPHVKNLLENGVPVLLYSGEKDFICNWWGNLAWSSEMEWSGQDGYNAAELKPWKTPQGTIGGRSKSFGNLTFTTVLDSGHFVPYDHPYESLIMLTYWLKSNKH